MLRGLPPIMDERARVLILGSFPSTASLALQQYYAHRQNQFWKILGALLEQPLPALDYPARQQAVRTAGIAIWDVYGECERAGSLDSAIHNAIPNDFAALQKSALAGRRAGGFPALQRVCFNGQLAGRFAPQLAALGFETLILPSTSPANATWSFERKLAAWREGLDIFE
ncbi:MAG: DNA-deoxyinosine glycosylase [Rhodocyclaceae bacterium]|jgi:hypoxanthine-DNA glycosylase|nr:DNA-deoxyinosine glycosylase [Rhodocyclaceae bacterium]